MHYRSFPIPGDSVILTRDFADYARGQVFTVIRAVACAQVTRPDGTKHTPYNLKVESPQYPGVEVTLPAEDTVILYAPGQTKQVTVNHRVGLKVVLDRKEVDLENPGNGTPAMVYRIHGIRVVGSSTLSMVEDSGYVELYDDAPENATGEIGERGMDFIRDMARLADVFLYPNLTAILPQTLLNA